MKNLAASIVAMIATAAIFAGVIACSRPMEAEAVRDQAAFARVQLRAIAASLAPKPAPAARAAVNSRPSGVNTGRWALESGLAGESTQARLASLLASAATGDAGCERLEGVCHDAAARSADAMAEAILASPNPGRALSAALGERRR